MKEDKKKREQRRPVVPLDSPATMKTILETEGEEEGQNVDPLGTLQPGPHPLHLPSWIGLEVRVVAVVVAEILGSVRNRRGREKEGREEEGQSVEGIGETRRVPEVTTRTPSRARPQVGVLPRLQDFLVRSRDHLVSKHSATKKTIQLQRRKVRLKIMRRRKKRVQGRRQQQLRGQPRLRRLASSTMYRRER